MSQIVSGTLFGFSDTRLITIAILAVTAWYTPLPS